jgi:hypothetical protein
LDNIWDGECSNQNAALTVFRHLNSATVTKGFIGDTLNAFTDVQMSRYDNDTKPLLANKLKDLEKAMQERGHNVRIYNAEVSFESIQTKTLKSYFNNLPTSLELSDHEVDMFIRAGLDLLRNELQFKNFLEANAGTRVLAVPPALTVSH